jgi:hypothetical protein
MAEPTISDQIRAVNGPNRYVRTDTTGKNGPNQGQEKGV